ncbi:MAG: endonuclease Q family protein, partial [Syntrophorhabdaceae bacterium]|nr:endonuclease Q family protein [Syntrophorhabdaceae bacterium]
KDTYQPGGIPDSLKNQVHFLLTGEISCIYSKMGKTRKIHCLVMVDDFASAAKINIILSKIGSLTSDGRPILGMDAKDLLKIVLDITDRALFIPAHAWTPHFSIFGAASGFDSIEDCFEELSSHIYAIETGLSSDPPMNWRLSSLDRITLVSNSDAHSPIKIGREANILETEFDYNSLISAIKTKEGFLGTIEFFPEEGKYHYDGHRLCGICLSPEETKKYGYVCPKCKKKLTIGVMHRVMELSDRENGLRPAGAPGYRSIIPLIEIIGEALNTPPAGKKALNEYLKILTLLGNEFKILLDVSIKDIEVACGERIAEAIERMRSGNIYISPGYDGEYGKVRIFGDTDRDRQKALDGQMSLF